MFEAVAERPLIIFTTFGELNLLTKNRDKYADHLNNLLMLNQRGDFPELGDIWCVTNKKKHY